MGRACLLYRTVNHSLARRLKCDVTHQNINYNNNNFIGLAIYHFRLLAVDDIVS